MIMKLVDKYNVLRQYEKKIERLVGFPDHA